MIMDNIKIHVLHCGEVCVAPALPFGGEHCSLLEASGLFSKKENRLWLPVSAYYIEHPKGKILVDCGWNRDMSPNGVYDKKAQIKSLGSYLLYKINQGKIEKGASVSEQLLSLGVKPCDVDYVLLTHLDCDHANGLSEVSDAKRILVSKDEMNYAKHNSLVRYQKRWWRNASLTPFDWNGADGPFAKSYDLFSDGSVVLVNIPGHSKGLFAVKIKGSDGKYVLLFSDGGYAKKSYENMITSGIAQSKKQQIQSLEWIRQQSLSPLCVESLANHDPDVRPHEIVLPYEQKAN